MKSSAREESPLIFEGIETFHGVASPRSHGLSPRQTARGRCTFGSFELRPDGTLLRNSTIIPLPPKELAVLRLFLARAGQILSAEELRRAAWEKIHVSKDSLPRCISSLRARLGSEKCIATVYKYGYRFDLPVVNLPALTRPDFDLSAFDSPAFDSPAFDPSVNGLTLENLGSRLSSNSTDPPSKDARIGWNRHHPNAEEIWMDSFNLVQNGSTQLSHSPNTFMPNRRDNLPRLLFFPFRVDITADAIPETLGTEIVEETMVQLGRAHRAQAQLVDILTASSASTLAARGASALEAGVSLGAHLVLTGSISALPTQYRVRAEMFRVQDAVQQWVEDFLVPRFVPSQHSNTASQTTAQEQLAQKISARILHTMVPVPFEPSTTPALAWRPKADSRQPATENEQLPQQFRRRSSSVA